MTECNQSSFEFGSSGGRQVTARFDGGTISSDGGAVLLQRTDRRLKLLERFSQCFLDGRNQDQVEHSVREMAAQRVYGLALGYEDLNDHDTLRTDPVFGMVAERSDLSNPLAGKSTLNRMELGTGIGDRYKKITFWKAGVDELMVNVFLESHTTPPEQIILDVDTTDLPLYGKQEGRFYHGYYHNYIYLPLYVFCGDHVLCARLREAKSDAASGSLIEIRRIVEQIRASWPKVTIILRGDSGFCRQDLMEWAEANEIAYIFGLARNKRLTKIIGAELMQAEQAWASTGKPARLFKDFSYKTHKTWKCERRVVAKAEHIDGKSNPRFVVTSLSAEEFAAQPLYENVYCARGDMENRIKEQFWLFADRVSAETMRANQCRLYFSVMAYILVNGLRRIGLKGTELASAQVATIRLKLLKIGAQIRVTVRRVWISLASSYPLQMEFAKIYSNLRC